MRAPTIFLGAVLLLASGGVPLAQPRAVGAASFKVIVNANNPLTTVERRFLADAFLKKVTRWPNDTLIRPADRGGDSRIRRAFSDHVVQRSVSAVRSYWQQQIFSGRDVPPPELDSDEQVIKFVRRHEGAVAYVSAGASTAGLKVLTVK